MTHNHEDTGKGISGFHRVVEVIGGSLLVGHGLKKRSLLTTAIGGYLLYKGVAGNRSFDELSASWSKVLSGRAINIRTSLVINKPRQQVYAAWRRLSNIPMFMTHISKVTENVDGSSDWELQMPAIPGTLQWKAEIVKEREGELIAWKSLPDSTIDSAGKVGFSDALGKQGTQVDIVLSYHAPLGKPGEKLARLFTPVFKRMILADVKNFKNFIETGITSARPVTALP